MTIDFSEVNSKALLGKQVRAILGVPEEYLSNDVISSPIFLNQAKRYINKQIASYEEEVLEEPEVPEEPEITPPLEDDNNDNIIEAESEENEDIEEEPIPEPSEPIYPDKEEEEDTTAVMLLKIAYIYYICYLLCLGMYSRLPKQMENVNTKTILLSINWNQMASDMLDKCNELIDEALEELGEEVDYGNTFAVLSDESEYPNTLI